MKLNFDPTKLNTSKDKFIWITIQYILSILEILKNQSSVEKDNQALLIEMLKINVSSLSNYISTFNSLLVIFMDFSLPEFENKFIRLVRCIPINMNDEELLN